MKDAPDASLDGGEFGERDLLAGGRGHEQIADFARARTVLRLHADDEVEEFFALDDLRGGLAADCGLDDRFDIVDIDAVARDFRAVGIDGQAGLAEFADDGELLEAGRVIEDVAISTALFSSTLRSGPKTFTASADLEAGERFVHGVFGGLREIEDDAGVGRRACCSTSSTQIVLGVDGALTPGLVVVGFEADVKLAIEEAGGIGAVVGAAEFGADDGDHADS